MRRMGKRGSTDRQNQTVGREYSPFTLVSSSLAKEKYRRLCQTEPTIPIFSRDWWLDAVCGEDCWQVLLVEQKEQILLALPIYTPIRRVATMPAYTQTLGPWFAPEASDMKYTSRLGQRQALCKAVLPALTGYAHFYQHFHYDVTDWLPFYWNGYQQTTRYTYRFCDLTDLDALWKQMSPNIRRNIIKARDKHQITVRRGVSEQELIDLQQQTFRRQGCAVPQDPELLRKLVHVCRMRGQGDVWGGYDPEGRLHAAIFVVWQESSAWYLAGGGNPSLRDSGAHSLVLWEAIRALAGVTRRFDFEGSMLPGVERFFREFGALQTPYFALTKGKLTLWHRAMIKLKKLI